ncbi:MAG TPA: pilin [Candidatus Saccharimonadales bacterium]|nr:pilin [Candidatus Saccharimonadales bacterium]
MRYTYMHKTVAGACAIVVPLLISSPAWAATSNTAGVSNVENFIKSIIAVMTGIAGLIATAFFVVGGIHYITSSGNPMQMEKAKRTITYSALGLAITLAAFVISTIVTSLATNAFGS